jgi:hypothetical protein
MLLSEINIYPVKSLGGISLSEAKVTDRGIEGDRRWMLVDESQLFLSQRKQPRMALLQPHIDGNKIAIRVKGQSANLLSLPKEMPLSETIEVKIWQNKVKAIPGPDSANAAISDFMGYPCRFVYMPDTSHRVVDPKYVPELEILGFADGFPHLVIAQSSLDDLNSRLDQALPMNRFRPNLVVTGSDPYEEFTWAQVRIGEMTFMGRKPCGRCVMTTVNQDTAEKGKEPLRTMSKYLRWNGNTIFGENLIHLEPGTIRVGDAVEVLERKANPLED